MDEFDGFERGERKQVAYVCFTEYDVTIPNKSIAFHKVELTNTFGQFLAENGKTLLPLLQLPRLPRQYVPPCPGLQS